MLRKANEETSAALLSLQRRCRPGVRILPWGVASCWWAVMDYGTRHRYRHDIGQTKHCDESGSSDLEGWEPKLKLVLATLDEEWQKVTRLHACICYRTELSHFQAAAIHDEVTLSFGTLQLVKNTIESLLKRQSRCSLGYCLWTCRLPVLNQVDACPTGRS